MSDNSDINNEKAINKINKFCCKITYIIRNTKVYDAVVGYIMKEITERKKTLD